MDNIPKVGEYYVHRHIKPTIVWRVYSVKPSKKWKYKIYIISDRSSAKVAFHLDYFNERFQLVPGYNTKLWKILNS